ncbi:MAG: hypothetical protein AVDCRST_MAG68-2289, partial [uncultured Gemmatimonadetes bacterium]
DENMDGRARPAGRVRRGGGGAAPG